MSHAVHSVHSVIQLPATLSLALVAWVYARGWLLIRRNRLVDAAVWQLAAFMVGLLSLWIAIGSPLTAYQHELLTIHMVQHVLLMAVAPALLLLGAPALPLVYGIPSRSARRALQQALHPLRTRSLQRVRSNAGVCWLAPVVALIGWHVPAGFALGMRSQGWHDFQMASFFATGVVFWAPVVHWQSRFAIAQPWLIPLYLFAATLPCDALSAFLVFCNRVVYPSYLSTPRLLGIPALHDQQCAGALMWVSITLIYLVPAAAITVQLLSPPRTYPSALQARV
jgi:cytochrome c oxidase assembly factor CtaG